MNYINRILHRHGFGIQSPWAYNVIRDVLFEHLPYYAFENLKRQFPQRSRHERQMDEQLFRLAHYASPLPLKTIGTLSKSAAEHIRCGSQNTTQGKTGMHIVVVEDIKGQEQAQWHKILSDPSATATFDIGGQRGIAFYNPRLTKQHYIV